LLIVDDIVTPNDGPEELRVALRIVHEWARSIRMRLNIGADKSAVRVCGRGRLSAADSRKYFFLGDRRLPRVTHYKYGGVIFQGGGGWDQHLAYVKRRAVGETAELLVWGRRVGLPVASLVRVWQLHVERAVFFGLNFPSFAPTALACLDTIQRKVGRMILGFASRCGNPAVLAELAWIPWSQSLRLERVGLLQRLAASESKYCQLVLEASTAYHDSWVLVVAADVRPWVINGMPSVAAEWQRIRRSLKEDIRRQAVERILEECANHQRMIHYSQVMWRARAVWAVNKTIYASIPRCEARVVTRWLCGGQGLRGGDADPSIAATCSNCCIPCLTRGIRVAETLVHILYHCPNTAPARLAVASEDVLEHSCGEICFHHRDRWTWRQLRVIRRWITAAAVARDDGQPDISWSYLAAFVDELWCRSAEPSIGRSSGRVASRHGERHVEGYAIR
jgi:hypothetical protein